MRRRLILVLAGLSLANLAVVSCGDDSQTGTCGPAECADGCCDGDTCVVPTVTRCGVGGEVCVDCTSDLRADSCVGGACLCAAAGAVCAAGEVCSTAGCGTCEPDCAGRCAGADDGCGGTCATSDCADGCCDGAGFCVPPAGQTAEICGSGGAACVDCGADPLGDSCVGGVCVCAATGAPCATGEYCSAAGCGACQPDCAGKCAGADDGCGGPCASNDCTGGCCDAASACVAFGAQSDAACGAGGEACRDCGLWGHSCDGGAHACLSPLLNDARFVDQTVPFSMSPGQVVSVTVTMQNIGTATWTEAAEYRLGAQNPQDNGAWGFGRVYLSAADAIAPGQSKTFAFDVTAPTAPGLHNFQWRMVQEGQAWFGAYTVYIPVLVAASAPSIVVCEAVRNLAGTATDAAPGIQACIDAASAGGVVEVPAGVYHLDGHVSIASAPITLRTEGTDMTQPRCARVNHSCAELMASTSFGDTGGILQVSAAGSVVDHIVLNGNKTARAATASGLQCASYNNAYGHNMRLLCSQCTLSNSVSQNSLCGTGCEVAGVGSQVLVWRNIIADNGVHDQEGMWADGVTVHDYADSTFTENEFVDNTDVDFIFGGCQRCIIQDNVLWHTTAFAGSSFAALMLHAWPSTSGNFTGSDTSRNQIDCGSDWRCGIGLYLGSDAWYITDVFGGAVHHNVVINGAQGLAIDDAHDMAVFTNPVSNPAASVDCSCGTQATTAYGQGTTTVSIDTSRDTLSSTYTNQDWDGCIPNWWH